MNENEVIWQNALSLIVIGGTFMWLWGNMKETPMKLWVREKFEALKEVLNNGRE